MDRGKTMRSVVLPWIDLLSQTLGEAVEVMVEASRFQQLEREISISSVTAEGRLGRPAIW